MFIYGQTMTYFFLLHPYTYQILFNSYLQSSLSCRTVAHLPGRPVQHGEICEQSVEGRNCVNVSPTSISVTVPPLENLSVFPLRPRPSGPVGPAVPQTNRPTDQLTSKLADQQTNRPTETFCQRITRGQQSIVFTSVLLLKTISSNSSNPSWAWWR